MDLFDFARARAGETITHTLATDQPKARRSPRRIRTLDEMLTDPSTWQPQRWSDAKKTTFLREATRQLKAAAKALGISAGDIRVLVAEASQSAPGVVSLFSPTLHVRVSISPYSMLSDLQPMRMVVMVRRTRAIDDYSGCPGHPHEVFSAADLVEPEGFAQSARQRLFFDQSETYDQGQADETVDR